MGQLWRAVGYLKSYWKLVTGAFVSLLIVTATNLVSPQVLRGVIDQGISQKDLTAVFYYTVLLLVIAVGRDVATFVQGYWSEKASQGAAYDMRNDIFARLENLSFSYHDKAQTGQLMTRVTNDVDTVRSFTGASLLQLINAVIMLAGSATILLIMDWQLALIALAIIPAILIVFTVFLRRVGPRFRAVAQKLGNLNTVLQENLTGIRVVKAFVREPYELNRYRKSNNDLLSENLSVIRGTTVSFPLIFFFANLGTLGVIWVGGLQAIDSQLSVGELVAFNSYLAFLLQPVFVLGSTLSQITQSAASATRVFEVVDAPLEIKDKPQATTLPTLTGRVQFQNVSFQYVGSETASLEGVSFEVQPGQTIAILGRTGAGKSTVINLIPRFYDASAGRVLIDGYDVRDVTLTSLRSQIGIVLQEATLFSGPIRDNIAYGKPDATQAEVEAAAKAAQAHDFIMAFEQGYDTIIGERGVGLSGGQRQRLSIARALLINPALLILDDSTSAVDAETEYLIQQALQQLLAQRTAFVIAQRVSTVRNADKILLLDKGKLIAQGTHTELLLHNPLYCELVESQLVDDNQPEAMAA